MKKLVILTLLFPSILLAQDAKDHVREGNRAYKKGDIENAGTQYQKALELDPEYQKATFNLGDALYRQEKFAEAAEQFEIAANRIEDDTERAKAWHNYGNSLLQAQQYDKSVDAYKNALKADPKDDDTRYNLAYAQQMVLQEQEQQKQEQEKDEDKEDEENEDKEKEKQDKEGDPDDENKDKDEQGDKGPKDQDPNENKEQPSDPQRISKEDAERLLNALNNEEKNVQDKVKKKKMKVGTVKVEKDW